MLMLSVAQVSAQSGNILSQTLVWHSESGYDVITSDSTHTAMKFATVGTNQIEHRNHTNMVQIFDIVSTAGTWTNVNLEGNMTYQVRHNGLQGTIRVERTGNGVFLTVDFNNLETGGMKVKYIINQIE